MTIDPLLEARPIQSKENLDQISQKALFLDQLYRQQVVSAMVASNYKLVIGLMVNHMKLFNKMGRVRIADHLDRKMFNEALKEVEDSLSVTAVEDKAFIDRLRSVDKCAEIFDQKVIQHHKEKNELEKLLKKDRALATKYLLPYA